MTNRHKGGFWRVFSPFILAFGMLTAGAVTTDAVDTPVKGKSYRENDMMCGVYSLYFVLKANGIDCTLEQLTNVIPVDFEKGTSSTDLLKGAETLGLHMRATRLKNVDQLSKIGLPAIIYFRRSHFVVVTAVDNETVTILNAPRVQRPTRKAFEAEWTGLVLCRGRNYLSECGYASAFVGIALLVVGRWRLSRLRRAVAVGLAVTAVVAPVGCVRSAPPKAEDKTPAAAVTVYHDFGSVLAGDTKKHEFSVKNESGQTWAIGKPKSSCGCTVGKASLEEVHPGEVLAFSVSMRVKRIHEQQKEYVSVSTGVDRPNAIQAIVQATPDFESEWNPQNICIRTNPGEPAATKVTLWLKEGARGKYKLTTWKAAHPFLSLSESRNEPDRITWEIVVAPGVRCGKYAGTLAVETNLEFTPSIEIPYVVFVDSMLSVAPPQITLAKGEKGRIQRVLEVRAKKSLPSGATPTVSADFAGATIDSVTRPSPNTWRIDCAFDRAKLPADFNHGWVDIETGIPNENTIRVPLTLVD